MSQSQVQLVGNVVTGSVFSGIVTATAFSGDGSGLTGVGIGSTGNVNTSGIITASKISANEFEGIGDKLIFSPTINSFSPVDGITNVNALSSPNVVLTYNKPIVAGVGTITLRTGSASGPIVESFEVGVSTRATIATETLTIDPTDNFEYNTEYYVVVPQGAVTNYVGGNSALLDNYNFTTEAGPVATSFSPADEETNVGISSNIVVTFDKNIRAGVGTITLRTDSAVGSIVESYDVSSSGQLTFSTNTLTINPSSDLSYGTVYYVVIPNNAVAGYAGTDTYNFTSINPNFNLFAWGFNSNAQLGQSNTTQYSSPVQIPGTTWSSISGGSDGSMATKTDGTLWGWGRNSSGQLGLNSVTSRVYNPIQIPGNTWSSVSHGYGHTLATKTDNTFWAWGPNGGGQLGQNSRIPYSSPIQIPGNTWSSFVTGYDFSLATKTDNTLWSWGYGTDGRLGQNSTIRRSSPTQIPGNTWSSVSVSSSSENGFAIKTDGTLWGWGSNAYGSLGQNNTTRYSSPVQIPGNTWSVIAAGGRHSLAKKTDNTLWNWGATNTRYSSPVQVPGNTWSSISSGFNFALATKNDNTLWAWGSNSNGQLGQGDKTYTGSPVQVPGNTWTSVSGGEDHSLAIQTN